MTTRCLVSWLLSCLLLASLPEIGHAKEWNFRVTLDDHAIGEHRYTLNTDGNNVTLESKASFDYRLLFLSVFRYVHHDVEQWQGDCLNQLTSETSTNGKREHVQAQRVEDQLRVNTTVGQSDYGGCVKSFAYWNPDIVKETRLLNSQTGEYIPVAIRKVGQESIAVVGVRKVAERYRIQGQGLSIDIWYVDREWVALQADAAGGRLLRYELR